MQVGAVEVEIEVKYENPEAAAVAGRFRVLSTSRLTSRIRQENIHNEREYEFSFALACWPLPPPRVIHRNRCLDPWKNARARFLLFNVIPRPKIPARLYIFN